MRRLKTEIETENKTNKFFPFAKKENPEKKFFFC